MHFYLCDMNFALICVWSYEHIVDQFFCLRICFGGKGRGGIWGKRKRKEQIEELKEFENGGF